MYLTTLIELGGDEMINMIDNFKNTPLHLGSINKNSKIVELLLAHGADIKKLNSELESVLHWSSINGKYKQYILVMKILKIYPKC